MPNAGSIIRALDFTEAVTGEQTANSGTTTSTSFTATLTGATTAQRAFVAPTSGRVKVDWKATLSNSGANATLCGFEVRSGSVLGSGSVVTAAADAAAVRNDSTVIEGFGTHRLITGLTAGASYNAQLMFRVAAGTGTFQHLFITVTPQP